ncbi:MAG TPA: response regulator, partial [Cyclobacteriaceae bacterium]|nr:response regulator [Cyclobacteriaceae bacterium]
MKKKVLIIDDEVDFGMLMKSFFKPKDFEVFVAHTIADGLQVLEDQKPDFLFLDNNLPDGLGWGKTEFILMNYPN